MSLFNRLPYRRLASSISCRWITVVKSREVNDPRLFKTLLDPKALALINEYQSDILYASYAEENRRHMTPYQRATLSRKIETEKSSDELTTASSSAFAELAKKQFDNEHNEEPAIAPEASDTDTAAETNIIHSDKDVERQNALAAAKRKILREMGFRTSAIEDEDKAEPDNWMDDYDTFNEPDIAYDAQYGTPGDLNGHKFVRS